MRTCPREAGPPGPRLSSPGERKRHDVRMGWDVNMLQSLFSLQLLLTHTTLSNKVRGIFFKEVSLVFIHCVNMYSACICVYMHIYYVRIQHLERSMIIKFLHYRQKNIFLLMKKSYNSREIDYLNNSNPSQHQQDIPDIYLCKPHSNSVLG